MVLVMIKTITGSQRLEEMAARRMNTFPMNPAVSGRPASEKSMNAKMDPKTG